MAGSIVQSGACIGAHCVINTGAIVEHDVILEDFVEMAPGTIIGGGASVLSGAYVGLGASVRDHITIGRDAFVAMGAVVICDVAPGSCVKGIPAR